MALTDIFAYNIDLVKNILMNAKLNPLSTADRLALSLDVNDDGYAVWDKTLKGFFFWTGTAWTIVGYKTFLALEDTPNSYTGQNGKVVRVNSVEDALEFHQLVKADVGLGNVDNTPDIDKPISTATQTALNLKADKATTISASGNGLTGGGNIGADRTFALDFSYLDGRYQGVGDYITALTGDGTATGPGSVIFTLATVNSSPGSYGSQYIIPNVTVNSKGLVTSISQQSIPTAGGSTLGLLSAADWTTFNNKQNALGYTPENVANKSTNVGLGTSDILYPTQNAVKAYVDASVAGTFILQGDWDANTNTPNLNLVTTTGWAYRVSVAGTTNLGGITDWQIGDMAVKSATGWIKFDNTDAVFSVNGQSGAVTLTTTNIAEGSNLYWNNGRTLSSTLTGFASTTGTVTSSDTVLSALQKLYGNAALISAGYVPYTGANNPLDMGSFGISAYDLFLKSSSGPSLLIQNGVTNAAYIEIRGITGGTTRLKIGANNSAGNQLMAATGGYSGVITTQGAHEIYFGTNGTKSFHIDGANQTLNLDVLPSYPSGGTYLVSNGGTVSARTTAEVVADLGITGSYIQNQSAAAQTASMWISGAAQFGTNANSGKKLHVAQNTTAFSPSSTIFSGINYAAVLTGGEPGFILSTNISTTGTVTGTTETYVGGFGLAYANSTYPAEFYVGMQSAMPIRFLTNNLVRMSVMPDGKVGIGNTSPGSQFDVTTSSTTYNAMTVTSPSSAFPTLVVTGGGSNGVVHFRAVGNTNWMQWMINTTTIVGYLGNGSGLISGGADSEFVMRSDGAVILRANGTFGGTNVVRISGNTQNISTPGSITAATIVKSGGLSTEFLKANGTVDTNTYLTTAGQVWTRTSGVLSPTTANDNVSITGTGTLTVTGGASFGTSPITPGTSGVSVWVRQDSNLVYLSTSQYPNTALSLYNNTTGTGRHVFMSFSTEPSGELFIGAVQNASSSNDFVIKTTGRVERLRLTNTGDLTITGGITVTGAILSGALIGTSAIFSGDVGVGGVTPTVFSTYPNLAVGNATGGILSTKVNGVDAFRIVSGAGLTYLYEARNNGIDIFTNATLRYSISAGGNHDFKTGTVTIGGKLTSNTGSLFMDVAGSNSYAQLVLTGSKVGFWGQGNQIISGAASSDFGVASTSNVYIGTGPSQLATVKFQSDQTTIFYGNVGTSGDYEATVIGKGYIVKSPDGTRWRITVTNAGAVQATAA